MITDEKKINFLKALNASMGIISDACRAAGISRQTFYNWQKKDEEFATKVHEVSESQKDFVEGKLLSNIKAGDTTSIIFYLKTKCKDRGYSEKMPIAKEEPKKQDPIAVQIPHDEATVKIERKVQSKKAYIVKLLKGQGKYTAELTYQVSIAARLLVKADMLEKEILADGHKSVSKWTSREGDERTAIDPKEKLYLDILRQSQKALTALGMNTESKERKEDGDNFNDFLDTMGSDD